MVLSETRSGTIGLTLLRVLRKGLWLGEYLSLRAGRTPEMRLAPAPASGFLEPDHRETERSRRLGSVTPARVTALAPLVGSHRTGLHVSTVAA
jgi:hypothetical protein